MSTPGINPVGAPDKGEGPGSSVTSPSRNSLNGRKHHHPLPGSLGPVTIATLMANIVIAAQRAVGQTPLKI
ncbi:hypothetical protein [Rhizobium mongolense]|uniref:5,10-methylene-tetrahydrofolate dehydrogenase/methenyl tetrahydrofolate cyclohydrolase n=1 Tax=Rhizobium mongolense TaxID=57676 RepID=A0A7W6WDC5_9HYPH|nr:5,10-methylene-tetrahydrofolate dehydrogenase/methenyl tetrahydrofolate cyclohydrolase [Rhizobium mongolense]